MVERAIRVALEPNRRNLLALTAVAALLAGAYGLVSSPGLRYAAWLVVFSIWMAWFVLVVVDLISRDEDRREGATDEN